MNNRNGFADALNQLNTIIKVDEQVTMKALEEAAEYFANKLRANVPVGYEDVHLKEEVKVVVHKDFVSVQFSDKGWYWRLVEHGHKKSNGKGRVKGKHFVRNTVDSESEKISNILLQKIIKKMEG